MISRKKKAAPERGILVRHAGSPTTTANTQNLGDADGVPGFESNDDDDLASAKKSAMRGLFKSQRGGY